MSLQGPEACPREARWSRRRGLGSDEACHVSSFPLAEEPDAKEQREKQMPSATEQQGNSGDRDRNNVLRGHTRRLTLGPEVTKESVEHSQLCS